LNESYFNDGNNNNNNNNNNNFTIYLAVNYNNITMTALDIAQANKNKEIEQMLLSFVVGTYYITE
jgi:hypothetical protein